jgi:hypothetical protein
VFEKGQKIGLKGLGFEKSFGGGSTARCLEWASKIEMAEN